MINVEVIKELLYIFLEKNVFAEFISIMALIISALSYWSSKKYNEKVIAKETEKINIEIKKLNLEIRKIENEERFLRIRDIKENNKIIIKELLVLKRYYYLFFELGNEFKESESPENFAPLSLLTNFKNNIEEAYSNSIYSIQKIIEEFINKISIHLNIALNISVDKIDRENGIEVEINHIDMVEGLAENTYNEIENIIKRLKKFEEI